MRKKKIFDDSSFSEKIKIILDNDNDLRKWHEGLWIKSLILLPVVFFVVGLFIINKPENLNEIFFLLLYPFTLIFIGVILLFVMRRNLN